MPSAAFSRAITVAQSGGDYTDIGSAITAASALTPTSANKVIITIYPGTYTITTSLTVPANVALKGASRAANVLITASGAVSSTFIVDMQGGSYAKDIALVGDGTIGGIGFRIRDTGAASFVTIVDCTVQNCRKCYVVDATTTTSNSSIANIRGCAAFNTGFPTVLVDIGFDVQAGGTLGGRDLNATGFLGGILTSAAYHITGQNAFLNGQNLQGSFAVYGILSENGGSGTEAVARIKSCIIDTCTTGINLGSNTLMNISSLSCIDCTTDVETTSASASLFGIGNFLSRDKITEFTGSIVNLTYLSEAEGDEALVVETELSVGTVFNPKEAALGGGDSHINGMFVFIATSGGVFTDVTSIAASPTGSTFTFFPTTDVNSATYIGGTVSQFPGIMVDIATASDFGTGTFVQEYWNGASWVEYKRLQTLRNAPYTPTIIGTNNTAYHIRFGPTPGWSQVAVNGQTAFWIRFRITSAITTSGTGQQIKLHTNHLEINNDGFLEYFGRSRPLVLLPECCGNLNPVGTSAGNQDLYVSDTLFAGFIENAFSGGADESAGWLYYLPPETDTSFPLKLRWRWRADASGGQSVWQIDYGFVRTFDVDSGDVSNLYDNTSGPSTGPNQQTVTTTVPTSPTAIVANRIYSCEVECDISTMICARDSSTDFGQGDVFWFRITRLGTNGDDTNTGDADVFTIKGLISTWCNGYFNVDAGPA